MPLVPRQPADARSRRQRRQECRHHPPGWWRSLSIEKGKVPVPGSRCSPIRWSAGWICDAVGHPRTGAQHVRLVGAGLCVRASRFAPQVRRAGGDPRLSEPAVGAASCPVYRRRASSSPTYRQRAGPAVAAALERGVPATWFTFWARSLPRYGNNPEFRLIEVGGPTSVSTEMSLPDRKTGDTALPASAHGSDIAEWISLGYTPDKYVNAWTGVLRPVPPVVPASAPRASRCIQRCRSATTGPKTGARGSPP